MKKTNSTVSRQYLKELSRELGRKTDVKRAFLADVECDIREYIAEHGEADIQTLYREFGTPTEAAAQFDDAKSLDKTKKRARKYLILKVVAVILAILVVILVVDLIRDIKNSGVHIVVDNNFSDTSANTQEQE